ncbi:MAG: S-ribosylhomocysteine lyase [Oenococcus oeni]
MAEVESFTLDHTKVKAPYVRLIEEQKGPKGGTIANYDLRLTQPNQTSIETGGLHTLEHLFASLMRDRLDGIIDISPFGCRTGFHMISWYTYDTETVAKALKETLTEIRDSIEFSDIPGVSEKTCGNFKDHSLWSAKNWAKVILDEGISSDPFERKVV